MSSWLSLGFGFGFIHIVPHNTLDHDAQIVGGDLRIMLRCGLDNRISPFARSAVQPNHPPLLHASPALLAFVLFVRMPIRPLLARLWRELWINDLIDIPDRLNHLCCFLIPLI